MKYIPKWTILSILGILVNWTFANFSESERLRYINKIATSIENRFFLIILNVCRKINYYYGILFIHFSFGFLKDGRHLSTYSFM